MSSTSTLSHAYHQDLTTPHESSGSETACARPKHPLYLNGGCHRRGIQSPATGLQGERRENSDGPGVACRELTQMQSKEVTHTQPLLLLNSVFSPPAPHPLSQKCKPECRGGFLYAVEL
jgi:hypothetical protein